MQAQTLTTARPCQAARTSPPTGSAAHAHQRGAQGERLRLARELHDSVAQVLFSITLGARTARTLLDRGDPTRALPSVEHVIELAEQGMAELRALLFDLRPESLEQEGLVAAITKQAAALRARHGIAVSTTLGAEPAVPLAVKEALYRITQEALHNIVKHAHAQQVEVHLTGGPADVLLAVRDDGVGFDPRGPVPGHLGLRSMQERVTAVGGVLVIQSTPADGTVVRVCIPAGTAHPVSAGGPYPV